MRIKFGDLNANLMDQEASIKEMLQHHGLSEANDFRASMGEEANEVKRTLCI